MKNRIADLKMNILSRIQKAAENADTEVIPILSDILKEVEEADKAIANVELIITSIDERLSEGKVQVARDLAQPKPDQTNQPKISAKEKGAIRKTQFIQQTKRYSCFAESIDSTTIKTLSGLKVGMAYASEAKNHANWFLGLKKGEYDTAVLICVTKENIVRQFVLPPKLFREHFLSLSRDKKNEQIKFSVHAINDQYFWKIPHGKDIEITSYQDDFRILKEKIGNL